MIVALPLNVTQRTGHRPEIRNRKRWRDNSYFIRRDKLIGPGGKGPLDLLCVRDGKIEVGFVPRRVVACGGTRMEGSSKRNMRTRWRWLGYEDANRLWKGGSKRYTIRISLGTTFQDPPRLHCRCRNCRGRRHGTTREGSFGSLVLTKWKTKASRAAYSSASVTDRRSGLLVARRKAVSA